MLERGRIVHRAPSARVRARRREPWSATWASSSPELQCRTRAKVRLRRMTSAAGSSASSSASAAAISRHDLVALLRADGWRDPEFADEELPVAVAAAGTVVRHLIEAVDREAAQRGMAQEERFDLRWKRCHQHIQNLEVEPARPDTFRGPLDAGVRRARSAPQPATQTEQATRAALRRFEPSPRLD